MSSVLSEPVLEGSESGERGDADRLRRLIERDLLADRWRPGERMPTEREFSEQYGVARNTVRRALQALEAEKLLHRFVGRGTFRAERSTPAPATFSMDGASLSPLDVVECRLMFEPEMAPLVVARATTSELEQMEVCLRASAVAADVPAFERCDAALHDLIASATHNQTVVAIARGLAQVRLNAEWGQLKERSMTPVHRSELESQHRAIVRAFRDRNREQARLQMRLHILYVKSYMFGE
jgi:DNA-binding FadR family transcriptional regulator